MPFLPPSAQIKAVAESARLMETTLWFDKFQRQEHKLGCVVSAKQFTICHNLIKYLQKKKARVTNPNPKITLNPSDPADVWDNVQDALLIALYEDWERFKTDSFWLYNDSSLLPDNVPPPKVVFNGKRAVVVTKI